MPLFDFFCPQCQHESEHLIRNQEQPACPHCGNARLERLLGAPAAPAGASSSRPSPADLGCARPQCGAAGRCMGGM